MKEKLLKQIKDLKLGDLVCVSWFDASVGKSLSGGLSGIDVPVTSWGVFIGVLGKRNKHVIVAQNNFHYADELYDIDYTAIPLSWAAEVRVIEKQHVAKDEAQKLMNSFLMGGKRTMPKRTAQKKVQNHHDRLD